MNQEIERKFAVRYLPENIKVERIEKIEQVFIYKDIKTSIRIRKIEENHKLYYIYTLKTKSGIQQDKTGKQSNLYEIENEITKEEYEELKQKKISNIINKIRMVIPIQSNLKVEIDIYEGYLQGFLTAEVEFPNEEVSNMFIKPDWLGEELGYKEFSNQKLAKMTKEEFEKKVPEEIRRQNQIIINQLLNFLR